MNKPMPPPPLSALLERFGHNPENLLRIMEAGRDVAPGGRYRHWDKLRHLTPPQELSHEEWWLGIKLARGPLLKPLPLEDADWHPFLYSVPDEAQALLHFIDQHAAGELSTPEPLLSDSDARRQYLVNSLIEEAIRSSQLEGAVTSRVVAKEMIRTGRPPTDRSERMIMNNYRALEYIREDMGDKLTPSSVLELQRIVTEGTLEDPDSAGRLQKPGEVRVGVLDEQGRLLHAPPPADQLPQRLDLMCRFANGEGSTGFLHPVIRAVLLHFWVGYDHPFEDGNGRTARALFYWSMITQGYWLTEYLSISRIFRKAPSRYARAYLYTETDDRDTTYFILYHLAAIKRAIVAFQGYVERKIREIRVFEELIKPDEFNYRQLALLRNAVRRPGQRYSFQSHARSHYVSWQSARNDLLDLQRRELLLRRRVGRKYWFSPAKDLAERLQS